MSGTLRVYRADVNAYFQAPSTWNGGALGSGPFKVTLPDSGQTGPTGTFPLNEGASLVVIYRGLAAPGTANSLPLKSVVIYDGSTIPTGSTTQTVQGFYDAVGGSTPGEVATLYSAGGSWNGSPTPVTTLAADASQYTVNLNSGNAYAAVIFSTPVTNTDNDGILDAWKTGPPTGDFFAGQPGYYDVKTQSWVALPGAKHGQKDLFVQLDYMCGADAPNYDTCDPSLENLFPSPDANGNDPLAIVQQAFAQTGIALHLKVGNAVPESTCTDSPGQLCEFPGEPGVIDWKNSLEFSKLWPRNFTSCESGGDCTARFPYGQKDSYHYVLFGHSLAIPAWSARFGTLTQIITNPSAGQTTITTASRGAEGSINYCPSRFTISGVLSYPGLNGAYNTASCPDSQTIILTTPGVSTWNYPSGTPVEPDLGLTSGTVTSISGYSDLGGADSAVTLALWETDPQQDMSKRAQVTAGTLFHEIGHTLGLSHGGLYYSGTNSYIPNFDINCKPNYQSSMNYLFQLSGVGPNNAVAYSNQALETLTEASLGGVSDLEVNNTTLATFSTSAWYAPSAPPNSTESPASMHCDGTPLNAAGNPDETGYFVTGSVAPVTPSWANNQDITFDGVVPGSTGLAGLLGYNDVANIDLRQVGATGGEYASLASVMSFGSSATPLSIASGGTVSLGTGGTVTVGSNGSVTLQSGANVTLGSNGTITPSSGGSVTVNNTANATLSTTGTITPNAGGSVTLPNGGSVTLSAPGTISLASGSTLEFTGPAQVTLPTGGTVTPTGGSGVTIPSSGGSYTLPAGGNILLGGAGNVLLGGAGNVLLGGAGTISFGSSGGNVLLGGGGNVLLGGGGNILLGGAGNVLLGGGGNILLGGGGNILLGGGGTLTFSQGGNVLLGGGGAVTLGGSGQVSIGGGGNVLLGGGGSVTLSAGGTATIINGGSVTISGGGNILLGGGGTQTVPPGGGTYNVPSGSTITLSGGGNVLLGGGGNVLLGGGGVATLGNGGNVLLGGGGNVLLGGGGNVLLGGGGNVLLGGGGVTTDEMDYLTANSVVRPPTAPTYSVGQGNSVQVNWMAPAFGVVQTYTISRSVITPPSTTPSTPVVIGSVSGVNGLPPATTFTDTAPPAGTLIYTIATTLLPVTIDPTSRSSAPSQPAVLTLGQSIVLGPLPSSVPLSSSAPSTLTVTATAESSNTPNMQLVSFSTSGPCSVGTSSIDTSGDTNNGVSSATVTLNSTGSCTITASQAGDSTTATSSPAYSAATPVSGSFMILPQGSNTQSQTITFGSFPTVQYGSIPFTVSATSNTGLPVSFSGPASGQPCSVSGTTVTITGAGLCKITATANSNNTHSAASVTQSFNILTAPLTVTAINLTSVYGQALPSLTPTLGVTYSLGGFVNGETASVVNGVPALSTTATTASNAGNFPITVSTGTLSAANYSFLYVSGTLTIQPATATISIGNIPTSAVYGGNFTPTYLYSGSTGTPTESVVSSTTGVCTVAVGVVSFVGVGHCTLTASATSTDYGVSTGNPQSFTVSKAAQSITFNQPISPVTYGVSPITLSATATSGQTVAFSVDPSSTATATISGNTLSVTRAGNLVIDANQAGNADYQAAMQVQQAIVVNKATLTVTANNATRAYGAANPTFIANYTGFVSHDTSSVLSGSPSLTSTATTTSLPGSYTIIAAQGTLAAANYAFTFVNGTLTVTFTGAVPASSSACNGAYSGTFQGSLSVAGTQNCVFVGGGATGNITETGGNVILSSATVGGNVTVTGGTFSIGPSTTIKGNLTVQSIPTGTAQNQICGTSVGGSLVIQSVGTAAVIGSGSSSCPGNTITGSITLQANKAAIGLTGNTVNGSLTDQSNTASTTLSGNKVTGSLTDQGNSGASVVTLNLVEGNLIDESNSASSILSQNTVDANLTDQGNTAPTQVTGNKVTGTLLCQSNSSITGSGNTASKKQGQCANF